jgi:hypothetical protein
MTPASEASRCDDRDKRSESPQRIRQAKQAGAMFATSEASRRDELAHPMRHRDSSDESPAM